MKKKLSFLLSFLLTLGSLGACSTGGNSGFQENVLRVASWDEYICMGGEDAYGADENPDMRPLYEEFENWYEEVYGKKITVEYVAVQDNETMYGKIKMGDKYDLLCPSEYMMMKLASEGKLEKLPQSFYDTTDEHNYYAKNLSPYIQDVFNEGKIGDSAWAEYGAGYMWGSTGFVYNPDDIDGEIMKNWSAFLQEECARKITAKDNVRDSYFIGLGMYYEQEISAGRLTKETFLVNKKAYMNDTSPATMAKVKELLIEMRESLYGLETDEGKQELITGRLDAAFQWSGDGVYTLDQAEENDVYLEYSIPELVSNLWFDAWVIMKGTKNMQAATAFINFLSRPDNVVRNMYYIGYTSCIAGNEVFDYVAESYEDSEGDVDYDLSYFFGAGKSIKTTEEQTRRQLLAQYPEMRTIDRLVVMDYFSPEVNERANRMWINIK